MATSGVAHAVHQSEEAGAEGAMKRGALHGLLDDIVKVRMERIGCQEEQGEGFCCGFVAVRHFRDLPSHPGILEAKRRIWSMPHGLIKWGR